jgi:hypothetical protein
MTVFKFLATAAAIGALAAPAAAQYYPQPAYPQQYPQPYPQQAYPQGYGYNQGTGNPVTDIIDQLLGNRYNVTDRQAVRQCANAARNQALGQYGGYGQGYGYNQGNRAYANNLRVTAITNVEHRSNGLRVSGMMGSGSYPAQYGGGQYGYQNNYAAGEVSFRCDVDYRGAVTGIRIRPSTYRR